MEREEFSLKLIRLTATDLLETPVLDSVPDAVLLLLYKSLTDTPIFDRLFIIQVDSFIVRQITNWLNADSDAFSLIEGISAAHGTNDQSFRAKLREAIQRINEQV